MQVLQSETGLENADLSAAYNAIHQTGEITARFRKKEDLGIISKSILKHRIQTLTGRNIRKLEEEMNYKPVDVNETGMNIEVMKKLAHCLILLSNGDLTAQAAQPPVQQQQPVDPPANVSVANGRKRGASDDEMPAVKPKVGRRSLALPKVSENVDVLTPRRGRKSIAAPMMTQSPARSSRRSVASTPTIPTPTQKNFGGNVSMSSSEASVALRCPVPKTAVEEKLQNVEENEEEEEEEGFSNPTPAMKELLKKRKSMPAAAAKSPKKPAASKSPKKAAAPKSAAAKRFIPEPEPEPEPEPRQEFVGRDGSKTFLMAGQPMDIKFEKIQRKMPLSQQFPGAHLTVVHTPADWSPQEIYRMTKTVRSVNKSAGLQSFVLLVGTGITNVHMNTEAMLRATSHVQLVVFHREDANLEVETGKLRETTSFFLAGYFFPGCEKPDSVLPSIMVREGFTTCIRAASIQDLEEKIIKCFSEKDEWVLDLFCGRRKLSLSAAENGRNGIAVSPDPADLEDMGDYLRTLSLKEDKTYRESDGLVAYLDTI